MPEYEIAGEQDAGQDDCERAHPLSALPETCCVAGVQIVAHSQRAGIARQTRQKALVSGPTSAKRTNIGRRTHGNRANEQAQSVECRTGYSGSAIRPATPVLSVIADFRRIRVGRRCKMIAVVTIIRRVDRVARVWSCGKTALIIG